VLKTDAESGIYLLLETFTYYPTSGQFQIFVEQKLNSIQKRRRNTNTKQHIEMKENYKKLLYHAGEVM
jgi:hypothetical protein